MVIRVKAAFVAAVLVFATLVMPAPAMAAEWAGAACQGSYLNDSRLGPQTLPKRSEQPVGPLLAKYRRTGNLGPAEFLRRYWDPAANSGQGSWRYPPLDGYLLGPDGEPIKWVSTLPLGAEIDRFGSEFGTFLAPVGTSYSGRALPPQSLFTFDQAYPCNYHRYQVIKEFQVWLGLAAPWFEQQGSDVQIQLERSLLPGEGRLNVAWLLANDYLERVN